MEEPKSDKSNDVISESLEIEIPTRVDMRIRRVELEELVLLAKAKGVSIDQLIYQALIQYLKRERNNS